ncbi:MAG: hypothetical protein BGO49_25260 [Planctomycetales bacterium 71-10]|nr:MAG: hypothetical protein BGO49_25260 [Planctomycetales bacterium 71-10]
MSRPGGKSRIFGDQAKILRTTALGEPAKVLMLAIYSRAHNGDGECWASNTTLADDIGRTGDDGSPERAVSRLVAELVREGWIVATDPDASKYSKRRRYVLGPRFGAVEPREPRQKRRASERRNHDKNVVVSTTKMS